MIWLPEALSLVGRLAAAYLIGEAAMMALVERLAGPALEAAVREGSTVWIHAVADSLVVSGQATRPTADEPTMWIEPRPGALAVSGRPGRLARPTTDTPTFVAPAINLPNVDDLRNEVLLRVHEHLGGVFDSVERTGDATFKVGVHKR